MDRSRNTVITLVTCLFLTGTVLAADGNRLTYLDEFSNPYYVHRDFPKLTTPQWIGEKGVEAVVVLAIDDMRGHERWEAYLRPILERLKKIDGRAPVSIMTCTIDPRHAHLQRWLKEGLNLEVHTIDHPCPLLQGGDFAKAKSTYDRCVDLMSAVPNNRPVAFRMPCCDSLNTPSPRFYAEIFNKTTAKGNYLSIDTSVFQVFTPGDASLPRDLVFDGGRERFRKYIPFPSFVNTIENYPYPYPIGRLCWQFPCMVPSDWEAQHLHKPNNPKTVEDMKAALDLTVLKQGTFNLVFHPHGWMRSDQVIELIDHAVKKHGKKVKFLTFREALARMNEHLLAGNPLRAADEENSGGDNGVRLIDLNDDGYLDVVIANQKMRRTRLWLPEKRTWLEGSFPVPMVEVDSTGKPRDGGVRFGVDKAATYAICRNERTAGMWRFPASGQVKWIEEKDALRGLEIDGKPVLTSAGGKDRGVRLRDLDGDGTSELIVGNPSQSAVFRWNAGDKKWSRLDFQLPPGATIVDAAGRDAGLRFVDVNEDGHDDVIFSNESRYSLHLFESIETGWSTEVLAGARGTGKTDLPMIVRAGSNNGAWFHSKHLWVQNENTARLPNLVDRRSFAELLAAGSKKKPATTVRNAGGPLRSVGVAKIDITPNYPVRMNGFGSRRAESEGVTQRIWAKALALGGDDDKPAVLITVDNLGIPAELRATIVQRLKKRTGISADRIALTATHTHTAPMLKGNNTTLFGLPIPPAHQQHIDRYTAELIDAIEKVALAALADRQPARLAWNIGRVGFARNRRTKGGPVDHDLPVLVVISPEGKVRAVYTSYACHCVTLSNNKISGDWAGFAQSEIEKLYPGAVALVSVGCGADANPASGVTGARVEAAQAQGRQIAVEVKRLLGGKLKPVTGPLTARLEKINLPLAELPTRKTWQQRADGRGAVAYHAQVQLAKLARGEKLRRQISYTIQTWSFGSELAMLFLPGEVVVDYSLRLKRQLDGRRLWINAYANEAPCYIPSERVLREGGYEGGGAMIYYDQPAHFAPGLEAKIVSTVQQQLAAKFRAKSDTSRTEGIAPLSPREALAAFRLRDGMQIDLVAAEPLIVDPVAFDWGPDGRLWVVEMRDYPSGIDGKGKPGGRIKVLEDRDGDGRYDRAQIFLDGIPFPTGVKVWRKGILVTAAPEIFYAEDTDGDGKADKRTTLYTGFGEGNQQHRVNGLRWGLDNWLYVGNGDSGGSIKSLITGKVVNVRGRDLKIRPDEGLLDVESGNTQFGINRDDWGNWFGGNNSSPMWHYVLKDIYLRRNTHVAPPNPRVQVSVQPGPATIFPASRTLERFNDFDRANRFTSACSPMIYRDQLLGGPFVGNSFVCEPVHNLVHREIVAPKGYTFTSRRPDDEQRSEFLASTDSWFRPSMVRTGPDGALWISDMYRFVIEHPKWIPEDWQKRLDLRAGEGRGRIYRVYPTGRKPRRPMRLDKLDTVQLVAALDSPNGPQRDLVQQMLLWRGDESAVAPLLKLLRSAASPQARLHALCTLDGLGAITLDVVLGGLRDPHPGVRRHAVRLSERFADKSVELLGELRRSAGDADPQVRLQVAYTLGQWHEQAAGAALGGMLQRAKNDPHLTAAVLSSLHSQNIAGVLVGVLDSNVDSPPAELLQQLLSLAATYRSRTAVEAVLNYLQRRQAKRTPAWKYTVAAGLLTSLERSQMSLSKLRNDSGYVGPTALKHIETILMQARREVVDAKSPPANRLAAIMLLGRDADKLQNDLRLLAGLLVPQTSGALQQAVVDRLARTNSSAVASRLIAGWRGHGPRLRAAIVEALLRRDDWSKTLVAAIESGKVLPSEISARGRQQLLDHGLSALRDRAKKLFAASTNADRQAVIAKYRSVLTTRGDRAAGAAVFKKSCSACHRLDGVGNDVGADLVALTDKSPQTLLTAILDPNRAVEAKFVEYQAVTTAGLTYRGMLATETGAAITLIAADGKRHDIVRAELEALRSTGKSLMPEGLEKDLTPKDMADVIAYVAAVGPPPKKFPGNQPKLVRPAANGSLTLRAADARIYGPKIVFEPQYKNLGWWQSDQDRAVWSIELAKAGKYEVTLDYACHNSNAGNRFVLSVGEAKLTGKVAGTGTWDNYQQVKIGQIELPAGASPLTVRSVGEIRSAMIDLRTIVLKPVR
ncbi:MAG: neutral/alkaline non-lysosomal ceramidase N-terminal domain-containing protein [Planctomycetes bacterium]|nr:neutral/alkaline non-lysosomal ceramidase N-terminal domain-containing protein [Planctomycetota bacterium]